MNDAILDKIRKLQALAASPGNEAEAAIAATRVQELLAKHNLELGEVGLKEDPGAEVKVGRAWRRFPSHTGLLTSACNEMFDVLSYCRGSKYGGFRYVFVGLKANVEAAAVTYEYLTESIDALVQGAKTMGIVYGSNEFQAFREGAARRIYEIARERKAQSLAANPGYAELVHIGSALAQQMLDALEIKEYRGGFGWGSCGDPAYQHGYDQGGRVDLSGARTNRMLK